MKFQNRKNELQAIRNLEQLSEKHAHMLVMFGRRRVGKTRLIIESMDSIYFFVDKKTSSLLLREYSDILKTEVSGFVPEFSNWDDFVRFLFEYSKENHIKVVFDEFQNFTYVDPAIFSIFQKYWDMYHVDTPILLVFVGSYIGLMKKIFINAKERYTAGQLHVLTSNPFHTSISEISARTWDLRMKKKSSHSMQPLVACPDTTS